jgi:hypothetical protein
MFFGTAGVEGQVSGLAVSAALAGRGQAGFSKKTVLPFASRQALKVGFLKPASCADADTIKFSSDYVDDNKSGYGYVMILLGLPSY